jgi:hypothetical protein
MVRYGEVGGGTELIRGANLKFLEMKKSSPEANFFRGFLTGLHHN